MDVYILRYRQTRYLSSNKGVMGVVFSKHDFLIMELFNSFIRYDIIY